MTCLSYDERLLQLDLPRLELRRLHLDLIYCYKIVFGLVAVLNIDDFFEFQSTTNTRGHAYKLFKPRCTSSVRSSFLLSVLSRCGTASNHLFVSLHYHPSDEQYMMLIGQVS